MNNSTQAAFEQWFSDDGEFPRAVEKVGGGYRLMQAASAWRVWQVATAAATSGLCHSDALAHAENAQDAARYHWVLPILTGSDDADKRTVLFAMQLLKGLDGDAAVDAAMKAHNEN